MQYINIARKVKTHDGCITKEAKKDFVGHLLNNIMFPFYKYLYS